MAAPLYHLERIGTLLLEALTPTFLDVMVDLETTGTQPQTAGILQVAAIKFDYATGLVGPMYNRAVAPLPGRMWDFGTIAWWQEEPGRKAHLNKLFKTAQSALPVFQGLTDWLGPSDEPFRLWAKPSHFEFPFLESAYQQLGLENPFSYQKVMDINSFIRALSGNLQLTTHDVEVPFEGQRHDAIFDALHDIRVLLNAKETYPR